MIKLILKAIYSLLLFGTISTAAIVYAAPIPTSWDIQGVPSDRTITVGNELPSNSVLDLIIYGPHVWMGTSRGVARFTPDLSNSDPASGEWLSFNQSDGLGRGGVSALDVGALPDGTTIVWASTVYDTTINGASFKAGGGPTFSVDSGQTWTNLPQPVDSLNGSLEFPTTTHIQNTTWDLTVSGNRVWLASWAGGIRYLELTNDIADRDTDDLVWVNRPPDDLPFHAADNLNHLGFSLAAMDTLLWVGTAQGVNLTRDGGTTWEAFRHSDDNELTISGSWIPAMGAQVTSTGKSVIWVATRSTATSGNSDQYAGICMSDNFGATWQRVLGSYEDPLVAHNFAFRDTSVYVSTDEGLFKSNDYGQTWGLYPKPHDLVTDNKIYSDRVHDAAFGFDQFWMSSPDGIAVSNDDGSTWSVIRSYPKPGVNSTPDAYAYPVPFSPSRSDVVRFQYHTDKAGYITLEIFDFAMELVIRPVKDKYKLAGDNIEVWDGYGPNGKVIANGAYFFRISGGGVEHWGKLMILD
jgi:hypothetical protein